MGETTVDADGTSNDDVAGAPVTATPEGAQLAERLGVGHYDLEVVRTMAMTPSMRRVVLTAPELADFTYQRGQDIMLAFSNGAGGSVRRRFTIRAHDAETATIAVHIVTHGKGPGSRWALDAELGSRIEGIGPRGKVVVADDAVWHLFIGDETFLPAAVSMIESLPAGSIAIPVLLVGSSVDEPALQTQATVHGPHWVHRIGGLDIVDVVRTVELPPGTGHVYIGGESHLVRSARDVVLQRGVGAEHVDLKAYWRQDAANAQHGEPDRDA